MPKMKLDHHIKHYRVAPNNDLKLRDCTPEPGHGFSAGKKAAHRKIEELRKQLVCLQELLYAEHKHKILIVLQAMDTAGKDSTIRSIFEGVNPQGVRVACFKAPTPEELDHDFLWRIHRQAPGKGEIVIFNRSHYEDVLVVAVKKMAAADIIRQRYEHINAFEKMLADEGTVILKFFLHIDKDEQKRRLEERLSEPEKHWKFRVGDLADRKLWDAYMKAYERALRKTSTPWAPWYVIPANKKWYRNLLVSQIIVEQLEGLRMKYPQPEKDITKIRIE